MTHTVICSMCGAIFESSHLRTKYCSGNCRSKVSAATRPPREPAVCIICGATFLKRTLVQRKCGSPECKLQYARDRAKCSTQTPARIREYYIFERDNFTCAYCGKSSYEDKVKLHVDHIVPRATGGESVAGNLITSCSTCNVTKNAMALACTNSILEVVSKRNSARGVPNDTQFLWPGESIGIFTILEETA